MNNAFWKWEYFPGKGLIIRVFWGSVLSQSNDKWCPFQNPIFLSGINIFTVSIPFPPPCFSSFKLILCFTVFFSSSPSMSTPPRWLCLALPFLPLLFSVLISTFLCSPFSFLLLLLLSFLVPNLSRPSARLLSHVLPPFLVRVVFRLLVVNVRCSTSRNQNAKKKKLINDKTRKPFP